ncbi:winged helix-turn-helix transcriptional regulator [Sphingomonas histidinilytica]|jgi:Lrp/AsnC family leucine-responsive transcriptional regulator|uniref:Transcriptional regulator, AsnC family n=1 Tax=Rhizorhabdus histidinilytica TaxID=439228 RepID=A0A1T5DIZ0_9SPHN|nr:Lrp/AsnC family transcriptional regulator [Rhizorhabdus histidinilytica]MBO9379039.1 winged helix-turn-helix transcriptional regulator [Rhizorhabdus histidinilytica]QEH80316.1 Lrp/AsnC family transcriptional regulator [Sphingomonas sp. C8-2]SKB71597.1 transcriptional regulator, AsnC family [Rhizorhabdus histidinilytica]
MSSNGKLDGFDRKILACVQENGGIGPSELSTMIHLSPAQCSRRLQRLKDEGYVEKIAGILARPRLNLNVSSYIIVKIKDHGADTETRFKQLVDALPEVTSCEYIAGDADYILRVVTRDLESYSEFISNKLMVGGDIVSIRSNIILKGMKQTTALPLDYC